MKCKGLYFLIVLVLGGVGVVYVQDVVLVLVDSVLSMSLLSYDDCWYIVLIIGGYYNDIDCNMNSCQIYYGLGVGCFILLNVLIDIFVDCIKWDVDLVVGGGNWLNNSFGVVVCFYSGDWNVWCLYLLVGVMGSNYYNCGDQGFLLVVELGVGVFKMIIDSLDVCIEIGYCYDFDDKSQLVQDGYGDWFLGFSIVLCFGVLLVVLVLEVVLVLVVLDCLMLDSDGDQVNDCDDKCLVMLVGMIVGLDGCLQKVVIDLCGVNFKFDYLKKGYVKVDEIGKVLVELSVDLIVILDQVVDMLQCYLQVKVMVVGYIDLKGMDVYNQSLLECCVQIVYDYLMVYGIDVSCLEGLIGYGENDLVDMNDMDVGCVCNCCMELQVQQ